MTERRALAFGFKVRNPFFRILYMKHEKWVRYVVGEMKLMISFLLFNFIKCLFLTYYYVDGPESQMTIYNFCIGHNHNHTQTLPQTGANVSLKF